MLVSIAGNLSLALGVVAALPGKFQSADVAAALIILKAICSGVKDAMTQTVGVSDEESIGVLATAQKAVVAKQEQVTAPIEAAHAAAAVAGGVFVPPPTPLTPQPALTLEEFAALHQPIRTPTPTTPQPPQPPKTSL